MKYTIRKGDGLIVVRIYAGLYVDIIFNYELPKTFKPDIKNLRGKLGEKKWECSLKSNMVCRKDLLFSGHDANRVLFLEELTFAEAFVETIEEVKKEKLAISLDEFLEKINKRKEDIKKETNMPVLGLITLRHFLRGRGYA